MDPGRRVRLHDREIDLAEGAVYGPGGRQPLTGLEVELLRYLLVRPSQQVHQSELLVHVWGYSPNSTSRAVANTLSRLRAKLEADPGAPRHLITVYGGGVRFEPAPAAAPPIDSDRFFGREALLARLADPSRLVTLQGPGGAGKTRLAREARAGRPHAFVDLAPTRDLDGVLQAVAGALGVPLTGSNPRTTLGRVLARSGPPDMTLDNAEQVLGEVADVVEEWLAATEIRFLVTSRHALGLEAEIVLEVGALAADEGLALLLDRGGRDHPEAPQLIAELEGMPLAIELAAARKLAVPQIRARLARQLDLLRDRHQIERHSSLRAVVAWSWELLEPREREALGAASCFRGGLALEDAEQVLGEDALDRLDDLVDHALLRVERTDDTARWFVPESVRAFAEGEAATDGRDAHTRHFDAVGRLLDETQGRGGEDHWKRLLRERTNLFEAARNGAVHAARAFAAICVYAGPRSPAVAPIEALLATPPDPDERVLLLLEFGLLGDPGHLEEALRLARGGRYERKAERVLGSALILREPQRAEELLHRALRGSEGATRRNAWNGLGQIALYAGELNEAERWFRMALDDARREDDRLSEPYPLQNLGVIHAMRGEYRQAQPRLARAVALHRASGNRLSELVSTKNLALVRRCLEDRDGAVAELERAVVIARSVGDIDGEVWALSEAAIILVEARRLSEARASVEAAEALATSSAYHQGRIHHARGRLEEVHGDRDAALRQYDLALTLLQTERHVRAVVLGRIGWLRRDRALLDEASEILAAYPDPYELAVVEALAEACENLDPLR